MSILLASYAEVNQNTGSNLAGAGVSAQAQTFLCGADAKVEYAQWYLKGSTTLVGTASCGIYAVTGTLGSTSIPTGSALATSQIVDCSTLTTSYQLISFSFTGANQIQLSEGNEYALVLSYDGTNYLQPGQEQTTNTHAGNDSSFFGGTWTTSNRDNVFYLYGFIPVASLSNIQSINNIQSITL